MMKEIAAIMVNASTTIVNVIQDLIMKKIAQVSFSGMGGASQKLRKTIDTLIEFHNFSGLYCKINFDSMVSSFKLNLSFFSL